jgi:Aspartyl protease/PDZ domain
MNRRLAGLGLCLVAVSMAPDAPRDRPRDPEVGKSYQVPYRVTNTNHFLVRVRINGKGPFNFLVDTGAPAFYIATETARKIGLKPAADDFWTAVDRLDFEGGARLTGLKARVEDPFQLVGMNALGLPGASIDGILGFTVLARFRFELDPTRDRMTWTRLDYEPVEPPVPRRVAGERAPAEVQAMNLLGPLAKFLAIATGGKQPEDQLHPRGFLGLELAEADGLVRVADVLADSPAARAGVRPGDRLVRVLDRDVTTIRAARDAVAAVRPDDRVPLVVRRGAGTETEDLTLTAVDGL